MYEIIYSATIAGRLTGDPEPKAYRKADGSEGSFVRGTIAVNRTKEITDFFNYVAFGATKDFLLNYLKKGSPVLFQGRLQTGSYKKEDGTTMYTTELNVLRVTSEMGGALNMTWAHLIGRLTRDPSIKVSEKGNTVARFTLAIDRPTRTKNEKSVADFIPVVLFGKQAELAEKYFRKGTKISVVGRVQIDEFESNGVKRRNTEVAGLLVDFARSASASADNQAQPTPEQDAPAVTTQPETTETKVADIVPAPAPQPDADDILTGFINIDDDDDDELPFN